MPAKNEAAARPPAPPEAPPSPVCVFTNVESYTFFRWLTESNPNFDRKAEVEKAAAEAGDGADSIDVFVALSDRVTEIKQELLYSDAAGGGVDADMDGEEDSLFANLIAQALENVHEGDVARAIMRLEGK